MCDGDATKLYALALHFLARHDGVSSILVGTKSPQNLATAVRLIETPPDAELLDRAAAGVANR